MATETRDGRKEKGKGKGRKKTDLRACLTFVSRSLSSVGVGSLSPEDVRQAKFDEEGPRIQLWKALHDLVVLSQNDFCVDVARALKRQARGQAQAVIEYAAVQLDLLGCPYVSMFDHPSHVGSRRLLLALTWLVAKTNVMDVVMERAVRNLEKGSLVAHCPTLSPQDTLFCHHTVERSEGAFAEARRQVEAAKSQRSDHDGPWSSVDLRSNQALLLAGKVRAQTNRFLASQTGYMRKINRLVRAQRVGTGGEEPSEDSGAQPKPQEMAGRLSCFEIFLAASKKRVEMYTNHLEDAVKTVTFLREFSFHIHDFLSWISTVKDLHASAKGDPDNGGGGFGGGGEAKRCLELSATAKEEGKAFLELERRVEDMILTRVKTYQASDMIINQLDELLGFNPGGARGASGQSGYSLPVLNFLVHLDRSVATEKGRLAEEELFHSQEQRRERQRARELEEEDRLAAYKDSLLDLSRLQARKRAQNSLHSVLRFMETLDITSREKKQ
ncbi:DUF4509 domain-containing protein [Chloropicon primus]|uniref:Tubulin epsilon and delta complex protein 1 domain-containing protein n=2 Tax=Chloropicon primus TaxID=1764295 RepID=A0A5B8MFU2_9CHLO|nr:hypothetical protein A3770_02p18340 [Chloropicon primus]UPQ98525.1 DUF4509 domain-containing protein [Chloropicon primus]|eukprot:QDZ19316.1 hypothetical protein A3770_02p18340 [Chloropicon primus]